MKVMKCPQCRGMIDLFGVYDDVVEFHKKFGIDYTGPHRLLPKDLALFRDKRLREEVTEYTESKTLVEKLDALIDLHYILVGTAHLHGFTSTQYNEAWYRVHAANMQKMRAMSASESKHGTTQDIIKPKGWVAPDLSDIVQHENPAK